MIEKVECTVIGAGVIGLAIARQLARAGRNVVVLEQHRQIGQGISSRNSEVIHAGIYNAEDSLKSRLCIAGNKKLYDFAKNYHVDVKRCGKIIVATNKHQIPQLSELYETALKKGVPGLSWLEHSQISSLEPHLSADAGILSLSTGIIDTHRYMLALHGDAMEHGAVFAFLSPLKGGKVTEQGIILDIGGKEPMSLLSRITINAAGLSAQKVAQSIQGVPSHAIPALYYAKGNYFSVSGQAPFSHLIYPLPEETGLGIHFTLDQAGGGHFGPDVEWVTKSDYHVSSERICRFYDSVRRYWPGLPDGALQPDYAGIRPRVYGPEDLPRDFIIEDARKYGIKGLVNLYGIESPGLTSSLAIAEMVSELIG